MVHFNHPDGRVVDVLAFGQRRVDSNSKSVKISQVAIHSTRVQSCTVRLGRSFGDELRQLATPHQ